MPPAEKTRLNNFVLRSITGVLLITIIAAFIMSGLYGFLCLMVAINLLTLFEFYRLFRPSGINASVLAGMLISAGICVSTILLLQQVYSWQILLLNVPLIGMLFLLELFKKSDHPLQNIAITTLGIVYITLPVVFFLSIAFITSQPGTYNFHIILAYFLMLWTNDSAAYAIGKLFGRHKLFKRISPGKTWEGTIGGVLLTLLVAWLISRYYTELPFISWMTIAYIIVLTGTFGDLVKSLLKRSVGVKDSGTILPGHGGMLDRFDSLLGSAPFVFCYLVLFN